ncbi:MAG: hypothetical protein ACOH1T_08640 [Microbacteriaceae bacterium]
MSTTTGAHPAPRRRWSWLWWAVPAALVLALGAVLVARGIRTLPEVHAFIAEFPGRGEIADNAPVGVPAWSNWQHFLNSFFLLFVLRTAFQLRSKQRPDAFWTRDNTRGIRTSGVPVRVGMPVWFHLSIDTLWALNGLVFYIALFSTGQWMRLVPLNADVIPNALSALLQYVSFDWPTDDSWVGYNSLQLITYFITVFMAGPLAVFTGIRLSPGLAARLRPLDRIVPRRSTVIVHVAVFFWFIGFTIVHVTLVLSTGALRNLNHMYAARDDSGWLGSVIFAASVLVMVGAWFALRPAVLEAIASRFGTVRRVPSGPARSL